MPDDQGKTGWVFADDLTTTTCASVKCGARITWAMFAKSGKKCPFNGELVALRTGSDDATGRPTLLVDLETSHFATCPDAATFSRRPAPAARTTNVGAVKECKAALEHLRAIYRTPPADLKTSVRDAGEAIKRALGILGAPVATPTRRAS